MTREIPSRVARASLLSLVPALMMLACSSDPVGVAPRPVASVALALAPEDATIEVGGTATLTATPLDAAGQPLSGRTVAFTSSAGAVVAISATGTLTAVAPGTATITATSEQRSAQLAITVVAPLPPPPAVASVTLDATSITLDAAATRQLVATARDAAEQPIAGVVLTWTTSDASVAAVSASGVVTAIAMGTATITATADGRSAVGAVVVLGSSPFDLLLDRWSADAGAIMRPSLHRLDMRTPGAMPVPSFPIAGSSDASPSPDGARIAFVCASDSGPAVCVADHDGSNLTLLTSTGTLLADQPAWSPDGASIAFRGWAPGGPPGPFNPSRIWVMKADGSGKVELTGGAGTTAWQQSPAWSPLQPDGSYHIAFSQQYLADGHVLGRIRSIRADGADPRAVTAVDEHVDDEPTWSPDGQSIAFVRTGATAVGDLWLVDAAGGGERALMSTEPEGAQRAPAWSPDGQLIAFASRHDTDAEIITWQIYTVRADGTHLVRRTSGGEEKQNPAWLRR